jgi:uncharacterized protein
MAGVESAPMFKESNAKPYIKKCVLVLHLTDYCNLACKYCYADKTGKSIKEDVWKRSVDYFMEFMGGDRTHSNIMFIGGEPLAAPKLMKEVMVYARSKGVAGFGIITNGALLNKQWMEFLAENRFFMHLSLDGIREAQNINRPKLGGQVSFDATDRALDLLGPYAEKMAHIELRHTPSPVTAHMLAESIRYYASKPFSRQSRICIMPSMLPTGSWDAMIKDGSALRIFREQMREIADLMIERMKANDPLNLYYNECLTNAPPLHEAFELGAYSCHPGGEHITVNMHGEIFPCHVPGSLPDYLDNWSFKMGDVWKGIDKPEEAQRFCNHSTNQHFSCPHWNRLETGDPAKAAGVYTVIAAAWLEAIQRVRAATKGMKLDWTGGLYRY